MIASMSKRQLKGIHRLLHGGGRSVYAFRDLCKLLRSSRFERSLPKTIAIRELLFQLQQAGIVRSVKLQSEHYAHVTRWLITSLSPSPMEVGLSLRTGSYVCHGAAVFLHGLTEQFPRTIYVNKEQTPKPPPRGVLTQAAINRAFAKPQRSSRHAYRYEKRRIVLVSGKHTHNLGVVNHPSQRLRLTNLERTLIDITVRPRYAGGVFQVATAFATAASHASLSTLRSYLAHMNYRYPYHQALGFYLQRAGIAAKALRPLQDLGLEFDFYLDYSMASPRYDSDWRVFYPRGV